MKQSPRQRKSAWFWVGIVLLCLFWALLLPPILAGGTLLIILLVVLTFLFVMLIIYGALRGKKLSPAEMQQIQQATSITQVTSKDEGADKLCAHLLSLGIPAERLHKHPLEKAGVWGVLTRERHGKLVQVTGKNIGYVNVFKWEYGGTPYSTSGTAYFCDYLVPLRETPSRLCRAKLSRKRKSFWSHEMVDIEWRGETLANTLNDDLTLKQCLLEEFRLNKPFSIDITPWFAYQSARLKTRKGGLGFHFPSRDMFDCLERIARHVIEVNCRIAEQFRRP